MLHHINDHVQRTHHAFILIREVRYLMKYRTMDLEDFHWAVKYTHGRLLQTIYTEWTQVRARDQQSFLTSFYQLKHSLDKPALAFVSDTYQFYAFKHIFKNSVSQP